MASVQAAASPLGRIEDLTVQNRLLTFYGFAAGPLTVRQPDCHPWQQVSTTSGYAWFIAAAAVPGADRVRHADAAMKGPFRFPRAMGPERTSGHVAGDSQGGRLHPRASHQATIGLIWSATGLLWPPTQAIAQQRMYNRRSCPT